MTTFRPSISGLVPLSNIYETPNNVSQTPTPSSWVDTLFPTNDSDSEYNNVDGNDIIEGMKSSGGMDSTKRLFNKVLSGIRRGVDGFSKASYFLPGKVDRGLTKLTTKATESVYNQSDRKPAKTTKKQVDITEKTMRSNFSAEKVITRIEANFQKIKDILDIANNEESFKTKQNLNDDFLSFTNEVGKLDASTVNGEEAYATFILYVRSIENKLRELYDNSTLLDEETKFISSEFSKVSNPSQLSFLKSKRETKESKTRKTARFTDDVKNFTNMVSTYRKTNHKILAEPIVTDYKTLTIMLKNLYYAKSSEYSSILRDMNTLHSSIKKNSSYYVFDSEIKELYQILEEFRFEKNATAKTLEIPPDNSKLEADKRNDAGVLKKVIYMFMAVPFLIIATYNWYYLIVYRDADLFADVPSSSDGKDPRPVNDKTGIKWDFTRLGPLSDFVDHLFGTLLFPTRLFNRVLLEHNSPVIPRLFSDKDVLMSRGWVLLMFALIIYFMFFGVSFKELIKSDDKCKPKQNNMIVKLFIGLTIFYYVFRMIFIFFGGSHSEGIGKSFESFASNVGVRPLNFNFVPILAKPIIAGILFILLTVGLFFIAMLSVNMSIMIVMMYLILHSLFGFYMYLPTTSDNSRGFLMDSLFHGFSYYRYIWSNLSNIFDTERKEWIAKEECDGHTLYGRFMIHIMGRIFTWLWFAITLTGIIYTAVKTRLTEMKIFASIFIAIFGSIIMYISWNWNSLFGKRESTETPNTATESGATAPSQSGSSASPATAPNPAMTPNPAFSPLDLLGNNSPDKLMSEFNEIVDKVVEKNPNIPQDVKEMGNALMEQVKAGNISGALETFNTLKDKIPPELITPEIQEKINIVQSMMNMPGVSSMLKLVHSSAATTSAATTSAATTIGADSSGITTSASEALTSEALTSNLLGSIKTKIPSIAGIIDKLSEIVPKDKLDKFLTIIPTNQVESILKAIPPNQINELLKNIPVEKITKVLEAIPSDLLSIIIGSLPLDEISQIIKSNVSNMDNIQPALIKLIPQIQKNIIREVGGNPGKLMRILTRLPDIFKALA
jgi:hypothetical protein